MKRVLLLFMTILMMSCSTDDDVQRSAVNGDSYTLVYTTQHLDPSIQVYAGTTVDYSDGTFEFIHSDYDMEANTVTIETDFGAVKIDSNFYIQNGTQVSIKLYNSSGEIVDEQTIHEVNYNYVYEF